MTNFNTAQYIPPTFVLEDETPDAVARAMIERGQKEPFYIFNMDETCRRVQHFKEIMPRVKIFYDMKSNDTEMMLKLAVAHGIGFSCSSPGEIYRLRKIDVNPRSIIYSTPCKTPSEMQYACKAGVTHTTFDSSHQLKMLQKCWPDAKLLIRIRAKRQDTNDKKPKEKFGCDFDTEALNLLEEAAGLGLKVVGVSFQAAYDSSMEESFLLGLQQARTLFEYEARAGRRMNVVDIGGGFPSDKTDSIDEMARSINNKIDELFPEQSVKVMATPGRYFSDSGFTLYCYIIGVRRVFQNSRPVNMIYLNEGVHGTMRFTENCQKIRKVKKTTEVLAEDTILWGITLDSIDRIMEEEEIRLPPCAAGDWLAIDNHGAYTFSFATQFSGIEIPLIRPVISKKSWNHVKVSWVFDASDFVLNPEVSAPLMSTLPPVLSDHGSHPDIPTLIV